MLSFVAQALAITIGITGSCPVEVLTSPTVLSNVTVIILEDVIGISKNIFESFGRLCGIGVPRPINTGAEKQTKKNRQNKTNR